MTHVPPKILLLTPVLDDWESLGVVVSRVVDLLPEEIQIRVLAIDDGSREGPGPRARAALARSGGAMILRLARTVGHQRAIAAGLQVAATKDDIDLVIVMDSDGEDTPEGVVELITAAGSHPGSIVIAKRGRRRERRSFRYGYRLYLAAFRALTGMRLDFGNFCLLPRDSARRIATEDTVWSHFAATVARSRLPKHDVVIDRGPRVGGTSRMNLYSLAAHGLGAMAVFADRVFLRIMALSGTIGAGATLALVAVAIVRLGTDAAIPGWATTAAGIALLVALQTLAVAVLMTFVMLQQRIAVLPLVARSAADDILGMEEV